MNELTINDIEKLVIGQGLTIEKVVQAVINVNGIIGVGLITLECNITNAVRNVIQNNIIPNNEIFHN